MRLHLIGIAALSVFLLVFLVGCEEDNGHTFAFGGVGYSQGYGGYGHGGYGGYGHGYGYHHAADVIGPADRYHAQAHGYNAHYAADVQVTGYRVRPDGSPVLDQFALVARDVKYQPKPLHIIGIGSTTFTAQATDSDINAYLNKRTHGGSLLLRDIHLAFTPQQVRMTASIRMNNREVTAVSTGTLQQEGATRIIYVPKTFAVNNVELSDVERQALASQLNPVLDLHGLKCSTQIQHITLVKGTAMLEGTATVKDLP